MYVTDTHHSDIHSVILWYGDFFIGTEFIDECTIVHRVKCCLLLALLFRNTFFSISSIQNYFYLETRLAVVCHMFLQGAFPSLCVVSSHETYNFLGAIENTFIMLQMAFNAACSGEDSVTCSISLVSPLSPFCSFWLHTNAACCESPWTWSPCLQHKASQ